jgi:hydrogenase maturation protein HypF
MCPDCAAEYGDPLDRRFHAQPTACPVCGPQVWLEIDSQMVLKGTEAISEAQRLLKSGKIVAIKGLGGFHLACDALNSQAVVELRERKLRVDKPFALMMPNLETIQDHCFVDPAEIELLESRQRPIVILPRRPSSHIASQVAPKQNTLGIMLPYTPLHHLLFAQAIQPGEKDFSSPALVMTSGNLSEEPIAIDNDEARQRLGDLADAFLMHDRPIRTRCDDSVMRIFNMTAVAGLPANSTTLMPLRRSRGYAPFPVHLPKKSSPLLAVGAELKNTFCILRDQYAFLSHYIGDMENYETYQSFVDGVVHFERLFRIRPQALAYDLHPNYLATRYALERAGRDGLPAIPVQHHYAHIAACMAEHGLPGDQLVIGASFDGTGYGEDGAIWGGEILIANYQGYQRPYHLAYVPLPGGDKAVREPWRMALAWLSRANIAWSEQLPPVHFALQEIPDPRRQLDVLQRQIETGLNAPLTSSMGRLFDAVAALLGIRQIVNYEAQAAIELEALVDPGEPGSYPIIVPGIEAAEMGSGAATREMDPSPMFHALLSDFLDGVPIPLIAARFHSGLASMVLQACQSLRQAYQIESVALSGGVWQNMTLLEKTVRLLSQHHFKVLFHQQVPANDGGLSLGQAVIAASRLAQ